MGIYCANQEVMHRFMYGESIAGVGPNEGISILDYFLKKLQTEQGRDKYGHFIMWRDNSPAQFKQNFHFFFYYMDYLVTRGDFLRTDLKIFVGGPLV